MNISSKVLVRSPGAVSGLYKASGAAALAAGALLLAALVGFIVSSLQPENGLLSPFGDNWLAILFRLHAGVGGAQMSQLYAFRLSDMAIMGLVALAFIGLYAALSKTGGVWSLIALVQPFLGMAIFIVTGSAGRSAVMGAGLVISLVMLRSSTFNKAVAYTGIAGSVFLLAGDLSVGFTRSGAIAALMGLGYVLLMIWLFLVSRALFRLSDPGSPMISGGQPRVRQI